MNLRNLWGKTLKIQLQFLNFFQNLNKGTLEYQNEPERSGRAGKLAFYMSGGTMYQTIFEKKYLNSDSERKQSGL